MEGDTTVATDSAPVVDAAPSEAVETTDAMAGGPEDQAATTEIDAVETAPDPDDDEAEEPDSPDLTEDEKATRARERRERRKANAEKRIAAARADAVEEFKRTTAQQAEADEAEAKGRQALETLGVPATPPDAISDHVEDPI